MKSIEFAGRTGISKILLDANFNHLNELCEPERTVAIIDSNVLRLYGDTLPPYQIVEIESGEHQKTLETVNRIYERFLEWELDRSSTIVGVGGGMVCDITGFSASTYLRGIRFGFVPTTLLALVDASVGGKNGVNYHGYKNLIGTFNQPGFVLCDYAFLKTLPYDELKNGLAEAVKTALICDRHFFEYIELSKKEIIALQDDVIQKTVVDCLNIKTAIISRDEKERGERRKLNFGHTIGHAIERTVGCSHGEAVSIGMVAAAKLSARRGMLTEEEVGRIEKLLDYFKLPVKLRGNKDTIMNGIRKDKKREGESIYFVLLNGVGSSRVEEIQINQIQEVLLDLCQCS